MKEKLCWETNVNGFPIRLTQQGHDSFTVTYGRQVKSALTEHSAARELGNCIFHSLACEGQIQYDDEGLLDDPGEILSGFTLKEWCERYDRPLMSNHGSVYVTLPADCIDVHHLYHLTDYVVSSRCGPVVYLVPRKQQESK